MSDALFLEDLCVGRRFFAGPLMVSAEDIKTFARAYDPQFFHVDEAAAVDSPFGGLVASGWQTAALTMRLLVCEGSPFGRGVIGAGVEVQWPAPVRPGDSISIESEIIGIVRSRTHSDRGRVTFTTTTRNQRGETVQRLTATLVVFGRPVSAP